MNNFINRPTSAFIAAASWVAFTCLTVGFMIGYGMPIYHYTKKGYYFVILLYGLFSAASLQKTVRDKLEDIPVTAIYYGLCWVSGVYRIIIDQPWNVTC